MKRMLPFTLAMFAWGCLIGACSAQAKQEEAKDAYLAQQMDCVKKYTAKEFKTVAEMDACRAAVKEAWGLAPDAGKDAQ